MKRKPNANLVIRLVGPYMNPWVVPMRALARVLESVQRLVEQKEQEDEEESTPMEAGAEIVSAEPVDSSRDLKLLDVRSGSARYRVIAPKPQIALRIISDTGKGISDPAKTEWTQPTLSAIENLSEVARSLGCEIELRKPGEDGRHDGDVLATIKPFTYSAVARSAYISGDTSIAATIERVGGATAMHCGIRLATQPNKMVICRVVGLDLARHLGQYLYNDVVLFGNATWLRHNYELRKFIIRSFDPPETGSIQEALRAMHGAGGSAWDRVSDVDREIAEFRGV